MIVVSLSMCFFSRTDSSFFLYLNSASNLVTIITGITQCKGIRIPESGKFVFVESRSGKTLLMESAILGYGIRNQLNESGIPLNPESTDKHWNAVPGIRNPQRGIHNPRLCWIPLHEATGRDPTVVQRVGNSLEHFPREFLLGCKICNYSMFNIN